MEKFIIFNILNCIFVDFYLTPFFLQLFIYMYMRAVGMP